MISTPAGTELIDDDEDVIVCSLGVDIVQNLDRIASLRSANLEATALFGRRRRQDVVGVGLVEDCNVEVGKRAVAKYPVEWIVPLEDEAYTFARIEIHLGECVTTTKVMEVVAKVRTRPRVDVDEHVVDTEAGMVACRREVRHTGLGNVVGSLGDESVLEHRFCEIENIVDYHVGSTISEIANALRKVGFAACRRMEGQRRAWGEIMNELSHAAALVGAANEVLEHTDARR